MSRDDLVSTNEKIVAQVTEAAVVQSPEAILVVVSNPLDAMCHVAKNVSGWPKERVFGMAGILDTARFSAFIAWETGASVKDVTAMVLGGHGDQMVPVVSATAVGGIALRKLAGEDRIQAMVDRTAKGGGEIVDLLGTSAWGAPAGATCSSARRTGSAPSPSGATSPIRPTSNGSSTVRSRRSAASTSSSTTAAAHHAAPRSASATTRSSARSSCCCSR